MIMIIVIIKYNVGEYGNNDDDPKLVSGSLMNVANEKASLEKQNRLLEQQRFEIVRKAEEAHMTLSDFDASKLPKMRPRSEPSYSGNTETWSMKLT